MRAQAVTTAALVLVTAACGGGAARRSSPASDPRPAVTGTTPGAVVAQTDVGPLPAPATVADLQRRVAGMPDALGAAGGSEGRPAVICGHDDSPLVFVALAPDEATLTALLDAWRAG